MTALEREIELVKEFFPEVKNPAVLAHRIHRVVQHYHDWDWEKDLLCCRQGWEDRDEIKPVKHPLWGSRLMNWARGHNRFRPESQKNEPYKPIDGMKPKFHPETGELLGYEGV